MSDIIDEIDALIDDQLEAGEPIGGYDFGDPDYPKCPHCQGDPRSTSRPIGVSSK